MIPPTSLLAFNQSHETAKAHRDKILQALAALIHHCKETDTFTHRSGTTDAIVEVTGLKTHQVNKRMSELVRKRKVMETKLKGCSNAGRLCMVWGLVG